MATDGLGAVKTDYLFTGAIQRIEKIQAASVETARPVQPVAPGAEPHTERKQRFVERPPSPERYGDGDGAPAPPIEGVDTEPEEGLRIPTDENLPERVNAFPDSRFAAQLDVQATGQGILQAAAPDSASRKAT
ncbi:hypothetical protein [Cucumibacter marinus]|uniref:hypothetical protein n=1 Tax=Cucumibacter marinus TaxID=1121252 RepID=UPI000420B33B|nr:hypothetical protein [Cucumibacter marinus]